MADTAGIDPVIPATWVLLPKSQPKQRGYIHRIGGMGIVLAVMISIFPAFARFS